MLDGKLNILRQARATKRSSTTAANAICEPEAKTFCQNEFARQLPEQNIDKVYLTQCVANVIT